MCMSWLLLILRDMFLRNVADQITRYPNPKGSNQKEAAGMLCGVAGNLKFLYNFRTH